MDIRVAQGGHNIEASTIERRYINGIKNLFEIYLPLIDKCFIFGNSNGNHLLVAQKEDEKFIVFNKESFDLIKKNL